MRWQEGSLRLFRINGLKGKLRPCPLEPAVTMQSPGGLWAPGRLREKRWTINKDVTGSKALSRGLGGPNAGIPARVLSPPRSPSAVGVTVAVVGG